MAYTDKDKERAFKLYCRHGGNAAKVARILKYNVLTIYDWRDKFGWDQRQEYIDAKAEMELVGEKKELELSSKRRVLATLEKIVAEIWTRIENDPDVKASYRDLISAIEKIIDIRGLKAPEKLEMLAGIKTTVTIEPKLTEEQQHIRDIETLRALKNKYGSLDKLLDTIDIDSHD